MRNFSITILLLLLFANFSCKEQENYGRPMIDISILESKYENWAKYHYNDIILSNDFIPINQTDKIISKENFLKVLATGEFVAIKLNSTNNKLYYKLYALSNSAAKGISGSMKSFSQIALKNFKMEGQSFPRFNFNDLTGENFNSENTKDKVIVIKCWFINCKACIEEFPELNDMVTKQTKKEDIVFISLATDSSLELKEFFKRKSLNYFNVADQETLIKESLGVSTFPTHIVVGKDKKIKKVVNTAKELFSFLGHKNLMVEVNKNDLPPPAPPRKS